MVLNTNKFLNRKISAIPKDTCLRHGSSTNKSHNTNANMQLITNMAHNTNMLLNNNMLLHTNATDYQHGS